MTVVVPDCSVVLKWFFPEEPNADAEKAVRLLERFQAGQLSLVAPSTLLAEFGHLVTKRKRLGLLSEDEARDIWSAFRDLRIPTIAIAELAEESFRASLRHHVTFFDATYAAAARLHEADLITADIRMANALSPLGFVKTLAEMDH